LTGALALSVVTAGIGQAALALLLVFLLIFGMAEINSIVPNSGASDDPDAIDAILYILCSVTVVLIQYAFRKTLLSRLILLGTVVLVTLIIVFAPYEAFFRHNFPLSTKDKPLQAKFTFDRTLSFAHERRPPSKWVADETSLEFPFLVSDLDAKSLVQLEMIRLELELPGGQQWTSRWHSLSNVIFYGRARTWPSLSIETKFYDGIKDTSVKAKILLGMRYFKLDTPTTITVAGDRTSLPGDAQCVDKVSEDWLQCFSALRRPKPILIMAELPNSECRVTKEATAEEPWASVPATYYDLGPDSGPDFDFSPIQNFSVGLSRFYFYEDHEIRLPICSGTRLFVSKPEFQYRVREEIDLGEITLANYHPTYPRKVIPPAQRHTLEAPPDSLSRNFFPQLQPSRLQYTPIDFHAGGLVP
jgi:hypothetical protein